MSDALRDLNTLFIEQNELAKVATNFVYDYLTERLHKKHAETLNKFSITEIFKHADNRQEVIKLITFARKLQN